MNQELSTRRALGKNPISSDHPAGTDVSYGDDFVALTDEIKKLSSPTAQSTTDWVVVNGLCQKILGEQSKNILVACYFSISLFKIDGMKSCALGVHVLNDLITNFWDTLFPPKKRKKGRINALNWWSETLAELTATIDAETWEAAERGEFIADLTSIDSFISENLSEGPVLRPLIEHFSSLILEKQVDTDQQVQSVPTEEILFPENKEKQAQATSPEISLQAKGGEPQVPNSPLAAGVDGEEEIGPFEYILQGFDFLNNAASKFFNDNSSNPLSYQLNRLAAWGQLETLPPTTGSESLLPPPDGQLLALLSDQFSAGQWEALLPTAEGNICQYLFWLDLSYWVATALEHLDARAAAAAVGNNTLLYADRLKGLEDMCFQGGLPFASPPTKKWLAKLRSSDQLVISESIGTKTTVIEEVENKALQLIASEGVTSAVNYFQKNCGPLHGLKDVFSHDIVLCEIMIQGQKLNLALPFAERILNRIDSNALELWDPELALSSLLVIYKCFSALSGEEYEVQCHNLLNRITLLAPEKVVNII